MEKLPSLTGESDKKNIPKIMLLNFPNLHIVYVPDILGTDFST